MAKKKFTEQHEWILVEDNLGKVGITDFAQSQLGDIVFIELPELGLKISKGGEASVVESVKAAAEVYSPVSGKIVDVNKNLEDNPDVVNQSAEDLGWFFTIQIENSAELDNLMGRDEYDAYVANLE